VILTVLFILAQLLGAPADAQPIDAYLGRAEQLLNSNGEHFRHASDPPQALDTLRTLYRGHGYAPIWQKSGTATPQALRLLQVLHNAQAYGLDASDYDADSIDKGLRDLSAAREAQPARSAQLDLALSNAALRFVTDLHFGRVAPRAAGFRLPSPRSDLDSVATLQRLAQADDTQAALAAIEPNFYHYRLLKDALGRYRRLAAEPDLTNLPAFRGKSVQPGGVYSGAPALRRLLTALGDMPANANAPPGDVSLDTALSTGIESFQERHGLPVDGVLGRKTYAALTVPFAERVRQIELTLERWRWLPAFATPPIVVNLPEFRLFAFRSPVDRESDILQMDVIVGRSFPHTRTPVFVAQMKYVIFRPYWDVPDSIVQREMLRQIAANPTFLGDNHMELVDGPSDDSPVVPPTADNIQALAAGRLRLRQQPGDDNALGAIKFMLPNPHNVYLHSTPAQHLFKESRRAFSHGCIRVSDPVGLALHVLRNADGDWTEEKIKAAMAGEPDQRVDLSKPIEVMILYGTVMATESGRVRFLEDIYGHDRKLERLLRKRKE
jgi:murein L,D-transpeptidase YcbB/YkuD